MNQTEQPPPSWKLGIATRLLIGGERDTNGRPGSDWRSSDRPPPMFVLPCGVLRETGNGRQKGCNTLDINSR